MKIITIIIRTLIGLLMLFASIIYLFKLMPAPDAIGKMKIFNDGMNASAYLMPTVKIIELLVGLSFVSGKFVRLFALVLIPISFNILMVNICLMPEGTLVAAALVLGNIFLIYKYWDSYKDILKA
jgi:putative oxidoreductase